MAFRTNKVPAIEERTVSGSSVSFHSAFALPLKACKVSFEATQAGSGDPSPSNPRAISGVSAIGLTANSTPVSISLGDTRYGGYVDVVGKKAYITYVNRVFDGSADENWVNYSAGNGYYITALDMAILNNGDVISNWLTKYSGISNLGIRLGFNNNVVYAYQVNTISGVSDLTSWTDYLSNNPLEVVYPLATPIEIPLSDIPDLSTILGNNTFSTDTGTLEITFSDLQEKTASGSVASFNTALAMPLASCTIAVNAWQEGSGDPSPFNVRPIHGFDTVHINMVNFNQYIDEVDTYDTPQIINGVTISRNGNAFTFSGDCVAESLSTIPLNNSCSIFTPNDIYLAICFKSGWSGQNENWRVFKNGTGTNIYGGDSEYRLFRLPSNWSGNSWIMTVPFVNGKHYDFTFYPQMFNLTQMFGSRIAEQIMSIEQSEKGSGYALFRQLFYKSWYDYNEGGTWVSVASVNGDSYPDYAEIQLGQEVYGAEVDVVNGVAHCTWGYYDLADLTWQYRADQDCWRLVSSASIRNVIKIKDNATPVNAICEEFKVVAATGYVSSHPNYTMCVNMSKDWFLDNGSTENLPTGLIAFELETPFDIQLTPTQIETLIGNNTIFADTGNIDITFKDLDIAKRGNFREVFKLPS